MRKVGTVKRKFSRDLYAKLSRRGLLILFLIVLSIVVVSVPLGLWWHEVQMRARLEEMERNPLLDVVSATFSKNVNNTVVEVGDVVEVSVFIDWNGTFERNVKVVDPVYERYFSLVKGSNIYEYRGRGPGPNFTYMLKVIGGIGLNFKLGDPNFTLNATPIPLNGSGPVIKIGSPISVSYLLLHANEYEGRTLRVRGKVKLFLLKPSTFQDFWLVDTKDSDFTVPVQLWSGEKPAEYSIITLETTPMWLPNLSSQGAITYTYTLFNSKILDE